MECGNCASSRRSQRCMYCNVPLVIWWRQPYNALCVAGRGKLLLLSFPFTPVPLIEAAVVCRKPPGAQTREMVRSFVFQFFL